MPRAGPNLPPPGVPPVSKREASKSSRRSSRLKAPALQHPRGTRRAQRSPSRDDTAMLGCIPPRSSLGPSCCLSRALAAEAAASKHSPGLGGNRGGLPGPRQPGRKGPPRSYVTTRQRHPKTQKEGRTPNDSHRLPKQELDVLQSAAPGVATTSA